MPYYLLIVADPEEISYRFQYELDVTYAVGRIHFDSLEDYVRYARSVVVAETYPQPRPARAAFVGVRNDDDRATRLSADRLIEPLSAQLVTERPDWSFDVRLAEQASKETVTDLFGGSDTPAVLFTAGHGMGFPERDPRQRPDQGALLCQDWPGPVRWRTGCRATSTSLLATSMTMPCSVGSSPSSSPASERERRGRNLSSPDAGLPASGGPARVPGPAPATAARPSGRRALAVIGHVDRAWNFSFAWPRAGEQFGALKAMVLRLCAGAAGRVRMEPVNQRYAELATALHAELEDMKWGKQPDEVELARMWTANNDARPLCRDRRSGHAVGHPERCRVPRSSSFLGSAVFVADAGSYLRKPRPGPEAGRDG